ncbi:M15 family metallopeptidase [Variibacter gotjawalensis]|nr:M15 family metallopeptidase [Variibacter gotjawalensis]
MHAFFLAIVAVVVSFDFAAAQTSRPADFVDAAAATPGLRIDMRYAGSNNFVGRTIDGYRAQRCLVVRQAAVALAAVQRDLAASGFGLKMLDCYRPARAVRDFQRWAEDPSDQRNKAAYYPSVDKRELFARGYVAARSGHSRGATVDLTLVRLDGADVDMGTRFDFLDAKSAPGSRAVSQDAQRHRAVLRSAMQRHGFQGISNEWWHFRLVPEPYPSTYFDFPVE